MTDRTKRTEIFDYVIVCSSFASTPYTPEAIPGKNFQFNIFNFRGIVNPRTVFIEKLIPLGFGFNVALCKKKYMSLELMIFFKNFMLRLKKHLGAWLRQIVRYRHLNKYLRVFDPGQTKYSFSCKQKQINS